MLNLIHKYMSEGKLKFSRLWMGCLDQNSFCRHSKRRVIESLVAQRLTRSRRVMGSNPIWNSDFFLSWYHFYVNLIFLVILKRYKRNILSPFIPDHFSLYPCFNQDMLTVSLNPHLIHRPSLCHPFQNGLCSLDSPSPHGCVLIHHTWQMRESVNHSCTGKWTLLTVLVMEDI